MTTDPTRAPDPSPPAAPRASPLDAVSVLEAITTRRSRRFALGSNLDGGPLAHRSAHKPVALSREEEAVLAFAGAGITGFALGELPYAPGAASESGSGTIMYSVLGRTVASPDAHHNVTLFVGNDDGGFMLKRPQDFPKAEVRELAEMARARDYVALYERCRVRITERRPDAPRQVPYVPPFNKWSTNLPGSTYFLPVNELTAFYINLLLSILNEEFGYFLVDERNDFKPAGLGAFGRSKGGHLYDEPGDGRVLTVQYLEAYLLEMAAVEQGQMLQNLQLAAEALGLGGFPHYAAHHFGWFEALGFTMREVPLAAMMRKSRATSALMTALGKNPVTPVPVGLERNGVPLLAPFTPPYYPSMAAAVQTVVDFKYNHATGTFRDGGRETAWKDPARVQAGIPAYSAATIDAVTAYLEYLWARYGQLTANFGAFRTNLGYQAHHVDLDYYDQHFRPGVCTARHREHFATWHRGDEPAR